MDVNLSKPISPDYFWRDDLAAALNQLDGDFSLTAWDPHRRRIIGARDCHGTRPLYYWLNAQFLMVSNSMQAFLKQPGLPKDLDERWLASEMLMTQRDPQSTCLKAVKRLPPGHFFTLQNGQFQVSQYWRLKPGRSNHSWDDTVPRLRQLLQQSVLQRSPSDQTIGVTLSGGLDSSLLCGIAASNHLKVEAASSVLPPDWNGREGDETHYIEQLLKLYPKIHWSPVSNSNMFDQLTERFWRRGAPPDAFDYRWQALLQQLSSQGASHILSGFAGDCALSWDGRDSLDRLYQAAQFSRVAALAVNRYRQGSISPWRLLRWLLSPLRRLITPARQGRSPIASAEFRQHVDQHFPPLQIDQRLPQNLTRLASDGFLSMERTYSDAQADGLTVDFPLWNRPLVEFLIDVHPEQFLWDGHHRSLARRAGQDWLPPGVQWRSGKGPFVPNFHANLIDQIPWLLAQVREIEQTSSSNALWRRYLNLQPFHDSISRVRRCSGWKDWDGIPQTNIATTFILLKFLQWFEELV